MHRSLAVLKCIKYPMDRTQILALSPSQQCWTADHMTLMAAALFVLFTFIVLFPTALDHFISQAEHIHNAPGL
jgi:hypothetical protein